MIIPTNLAGGSPAQRLDATRMQAALAMDGADLGILPEFRHIQPQLDVHLFEQLPSTSTHLWKLLAAGAGAGTVVIAERQSSGRGQRGHTWVSEAGGLYLSLALLPDWSVVHSAQLTCLSAWGMVTAFNRLGIPIQIKWPNDLFFEGKKLGGILTETKLAQPSSAKAGDGNEPKPLPCIKQAVIGVGINWHNSVPETGITLAKILEMIPERAAQNKINCLEVLAALVIRGILQGVFFRQRVGSQVFMKVYQNLLTQVGKVVSLSNDLAADVASSQRINVSGEVLGVSEEGHLRVALEPALGLASNEAAQANGRCSDGGLSAKSFLGGGLSGKGRSEVTSFGQAQFVGSDAEDREREVLLLKASELHIS